MNQSTNIRLNDRGDIHPQKYKFQIIARRKVEEECSSNELFCYRLTGRRADRLTRGMQRDRTACCSRIYNYHIVEASKISRLFVSYERLWSRTTFVPTRRWWQLSRNLFHGCGYSTIFNVASRNFYLPENSLRNRYSIVSLLTFFSDKLPIPFNVHPFALPFCFSSNPCRIPWPNDRQNKRTLG